MPVNFIHYQQTINILTETKPPTNLYLKKLDKNGTLVDVCFLEKLFRIIARCFGFYKNTTVITELKFAVVKQLAPHLSLNTKENGPDSFKTIATAIDRLIHRSKESPTAIPLVAPRSELPAPLSQELIHPLPVASTPMTLPAFILGMVPGQLLTTETLDPVNELEQMDNKKFLDFLENDLPINKLDQQIDKILISIPRSKIPTLLTYAALLDPKYANVTTENLALSYSTRNSTDDAEIKSSLTAIATLDLIATSPSDLSDRLSAYFNINIKNGFVFNKWALELGRRSNSDEIGRIFLVFGDSDFKINKSAFSYYFFKGIFKQECKTKIVEAVSKFWPVKHKFLDPGAGAMHAFCEIQRIETLNEILRTLKTLNNNTSASTNNNESIKEFSVFVDWISALLFPISLPLKNNHRSLKFVPKWTKEQKWFILELYPWLATLLFTHQQTKLADLHQSISPNTTLDDWLNQLQQRTTITKWKAQLPDQLPPELQTVIFDYWILPQ